MSGYCVTGMETNPRIPKITTMMEITYQKLIHTHMGEKTHRGVNQFLIGDVQQIRRAGRVKLQSRAGGQGFQQQMHLRIVAQGFKMSHAFHSIGNGFLVEDSPGIQGYIQIETFFYQTAENF